MAGKDYMFIAAVACLVVLAQARVPPKFVTEGPLTAMPWTPVTDEPNIGCYWDRYSCSKSDCHVTQLFGWHFCCFPWNQHPLCLLKPTILGDSSP